MRLLSWLLILILVGCGGEAFEAATTRVKAGSEPGDSAPQPDAPGTTVDATGEPDVIPSLPESGSDSWADLDAPEGDGGVEAGQDTGVDAPLEAKEDPKAACGCYRNEAMDSHCNWPNLEAWVCNGCNPVGCVAEYAPQPTLSCCGGQDE